MKIFVWATAKGSQERIEWLKENYNKPITEDEYIEFEKSLPHNHPHAADCRTPSKARKRYNHLKDIYGFFVPEARAE